MRNNVAKPLLSSMEVFFRSRFASRTGIRDSEMFNSSGIGQDNQVVVRRVFLEVHFVIFSQIFLPHLLGAFHVRELIEESRGLLSGSPKQIVQLLCFW